MNEPSNNYSSFSQRLFYRFLRHKAHYSPSPVKGRQSLYPTFKSQTGKLDRISSVKQSVLEKGIDKEIHTVFNSIHKLNHSLIKRNYDPAAPGRILRASPQLDTDPTRNREYSLFCAQNDIRRSMQERQKNKKSERKAHCRLESTSNIESSPYSLIDRSLIAPANEESNEMEREIHQIVKHRVKNIVKHLDKDEEQFSNEGMIKKEWHDTVMRAKRNFILHVFKKHEFPQILDRIKKSYKLLNRKRERKMSIPLEQPQAFRIVQKFDSIFRQKNQNLQILTNKYILNKEKTTPLIIKEQYNLEKMLSQDMRKLGIITFK
jgi:hypothetical protein